MTQPTIPDMFLPMTTATYDTFVNGAVIADDKISMIQWIMYFNMTLYAKGEAKGTAFDKESKAMLILVGDAFRHAGWDTVINETNGEPYLKQEPVTILTIRRHAASS